MSKNGIIICDSGIPKYLENTIEVIDIGMGVLDEHGHGTNIINMLREINPCVNIKSIKVLDKNKSSDLSVFLKALDACKSFQECVVLLSLSIDKVDECSELENAINELVECGKIIVASKHNRQSRSIPSRYRNVIGVEAHEQAPFVIVDGLDETQCKLKKNIIFVKNHMNVYSTLSGNSLLAPLVALMINHLLYDEQEPGIDQILRSLSTNDASDFIERRFNGPLENISMDIEKVKGIILNVLSDNNIELKEDVFIENFDQPSLAKFLGHEGLSEFTINKKSFLRLEDLESLNAFAAYLNYNSL